MQNTILENQGEFVQTLLASLGGLYVFAQGFLKPQVPTATPQPLRRQLSFALSSCTPFFEWLHLLNLSGAVKLGSPVGELAARKG